MEAHEGNERARYWRDQLLKSPRVVTRIMFKRVTAGQELKASRNKGV